ncbi:MAG: hypothetical protein RL145_85 [Pseudomonadota bacterium]|jgi:hypothetical protein
MISAVYSRAQLMTLLGYKCPKSFRARLPALYAVGFPLPLPLRGSAKWSAPQVDHWIATGGRTPLASASSSSKSDRPSKDDLKVSHLDAARARLSVQANRFSS